MDEKSRNNTDDERWRKKSMKGRKNAIEGKEVINEKNESTGGKSSTVKWKLGMSSERKINKGGRESY